MLKTKDEDGSEHWKVSAETARGRLDFDVTTDGSYQPDAFDQLFGVWRDLEPCPGEFHSARVVLGDEAMGELAALLDW